MPVPFEANPTSSRSLTQAVASSIGPPNLKAATNVHPHSLPSPSKATILALILLGLSQQPLPPQKKGGDNVLTEQENVRYANGASTSYLCPATHLKTINIGP